MSDFVKKTVSLEQDSIGSYVKKIRERRGIDINEVAKKTGVNVKYLVAIESGNYKDLPKGIYSKIFFKKYIDFLEIRYKNIVNDFIREKNRSQNFESNIFFNRVVNWKNLLSFPKILRNILIALLIVICFLYLFFYFRGIFSPPSLEITYPLNDQIISEYDINIIGKTEPESEIKINGQLILIGKDGDFSENIRLRSGINNIVIEAKKKYSRERVIIRKILVE